MTCYPGDPTFQSKLYSSLADGCNVHSMTLGSHTGTHVDAPYHFFSDGKKIDELPLSAFIGTALVINMTSKTAREPIVWEDLASFSNAMSSDVILLLHTGWSKHWNTPRYLDHPFLTPHCAEQVVAKGVRVLGVDTLSPDETRVDGTEGKYGFGVHEAILGNGGIIAENLTNLAAVAAADATISLIPLNIAGCDGSPIRAFATIRGI